MVWKTKYPKNPKMDDQVIVKRFALFPVKTDDGYTIWLDTYYAHRRYGYSYVEGIAGPFKMWDWTTYYKTINK